MLRRGGLNSLRRPIKIGILPAWLGFRSSRRGQPARRKGRAGPCGSATGPL